MFAGQEPMVEMSPGIAAPFTDEGASVKDKGTAVGPILKAGLSIRPMLSLDAETNTVYLRGARVLYQEQEVFTVNETGRQLLYLADGSVTISDMIERLNIRENPEQVGLFFVRLGQSGYLENRVEIKLYKTEKSLEVRP